VVIAATYVMPAQAQLASTFGKTTTGAIPSAGLSADHKRASRFTLTEPAMVKDLCVYLDGNGGATGYQSVQFALYTDVNGVPGTKVLNTQGWALQSGTAPQWYCRSSDFGVTPPVPAGRYWIAILSSAPAGILRDFGDGTGSNWYGNADSFNDGPANSFGSGSAGTGTLSAYVHYYAQSQLRAAGRTTIGTTPSAGMTANYKRGSSFVMPQRGKVTAIAAYVDGLGSTNFDDQAVYASVIYKDANGVPGDKVYDSGDVFGSAVRGTSPPAWRAWGIFPGSQPTLDAGRYWLVLHTGGIVGFNGGLTDFSSVIRNYADGTGNWYGNADAFSDGASSPFGPGKTGNGTISAYISYRPGTITSGEIGRHDIATTPSRGLDANVTRWSSFVLWDNGATLTGLHAYLDGLGSASGSQQVRMVLYGYHYVSYLDGSSYSWYAKVAESAVVTIAAGMQPRWVDFTVPQVPMTDADPPIYLIGIQSGGPNAVARDYGDNRSDLGANWHSRPDTFGDGADDEIPETDPIKNGDVTLSVYASFSLPPP
jgi:hypothetical protein